MAKERCRDCQGGLSCLFGRSRLIYLIAQRLARCLPVFALALLACLQGCAIQGAIAVKDVPPDYLAPPPKLVKTLDLTKLARPTDTQNRLLPGDVLEVNCSNLFEESSRESKESETFPVRIAADGTVSLPLLSQRVGISSMTVGEAEQVMRNAYRTAQLIRRPQLTVKVLEYKKNKIYVIGAVKKAGMYQLRPDHCDPLRAIAAAEGVTEEAGTVVEIRRAVKRPMQKPASSSKANEETADVVYLPGAGSLEKLQEPAKKAGHVDALEGVSLRMVDFPLPTSEQKTAEDEQIIRFDLVTGTVLEIRQTGALPKPASSTLTHEGIVYLVYSTVDEPLKNVQEPAKKPGVLGTLEPPPIRTAGDDQIIRFDLTSNEIRVRPDQLQLQNGDIVSVEQKRIRPFFVTGSVNKPGEFPMPSGRDVRVLEAVGMAGGVLATSDPNKALLIRRPDRKPPIVILIELDRAGRYPQENLSLMEGDVIEVVEDSASRTRRTIRQFLRIGFTPLPKN